LAGPNLPPAVNYGPHIRTQAVFERPEAERPQGDTLQGISDWLIDAARRNSSFAEIIDEYAWRLVAAGMPLLGVSLHAETLHPQFLGATYLWWRDPGQTHTLMIEHEIAGRIPYSENLVRQVREGGQTLRLRMDEAGYQLDFPILRELKPRGATEFLALPIASPFGLERYMVGYAADRPGGFTEKEVADLTFLSRRLSVIADMNSQKMIVENVLRAYLGPRTGPRVLAGQIRRGGGESIAAVIWSSDLRAFTALSDRLPSERVIAILNDLFDLQARTIADHGGEVLKFIGDGLLAIFPVADPTGAARAARGALEAARETLAALAERRARAPSEAEPPPKIVIALHYGTVVYGNIGAADRLDFTVIGPAVNLVSRIETIAKSLDLPLIVSDDFAAIYGEKLPSLGRHKLRGLEQPHELFAP